MTLRHNRCQLLLVAVLVTILGTASVGRASGESPATPEEATTADTLKTPTEALPPWQRMLSGQDSLHVAGLEEQITELREQAKYVEAVPLAEEILEMRRRVQGEAHWEVTDAVQVVETLKYVADLPSEARAELAEADGSGPEVERFYEQGKYGEAIALAERQLEVRERLLGKEHPDVAISLNDLGVMLSNKGDYARAELLYREALAMQRKLLGGEHPDLARSLCNLAVLLGRKGDYAGAEPLHREALAMKRELLGEESPEVVLSLGSLAAVLVHKGDYAGAEPLLRQALALQRKLLGEEHPDLAKILNSLAVLLVRKGEYAGAEPLYREALAMRRKLLGEEHPDVAQSVDNLAGLLARKGDYAGAERLHREALAMKRKLLGEEHPDVAVSLNGLGAVLVQKGDYAGAEPLYRESLAIWRKVLGPEHPHVAASLHNLAARLVARGDYAGAEPLYREALAMQRKALGEEHPDLAWILNGLAVLLEARGDYAGAEPLFREALAMRRKLLGEEHPEVARSLDTLAGLLTLRGDYADAESLFREALAMRRKLLGEEHPEVAASLHNLAALLTFRGDDAGAEPLYREALAMQRKVLGREHPDLATSLNNLAKLLEDRGDRAGAGPLYREALAVGRKVLGEGHPNVARSLNGLAGLLADRGNYAAAETAWVAAAESFEAARLRMSRVGLGRVEFATTRSPLVPLAACLARNGRPVLAWTRLETNMARGLLDEVSARASRPLEPEERDREESLAGQLGKLDEQIGEPSSANDSTGEAAAWADSLRWRRDALLAELSRFQADMAAKYGVAAGETYELGRIQENLPADAALVAWVDVKGDSHAVDPNGEHWACVIKQQGGPAWVKLPGSGDDGSWTEADDEQPNRVREALGERAAGVEGGAPQELLQRLYAQRLAPVEPHLAGAGRLIVLPAGWMAGIPVEALTEDYAVSYAPSATMYAWLKEGRRSKVPGRRSQEEAPRPHRSDEEAWRPLLALGDPVFGEPVEPDTVLPEPPDQGVMLAMVMDGSNAARGGLRSGDVILSYGEKQLGTAEDLAPAIEQAAEAAEDTSRSVPVRVWREGETLDAAVAPGKLGVSPSPQPAPEAVRAKRQLDSVLEQTRGKTFEPLPGSRLEVEAIAGLFSAGADEAAPTLLLGTDASERRLDELAMSGDLGRYRHIHLATHALMDDEVAMRSALILSKEPEDDALQRVLEGEEVYDGMLTAEQIVQTWKLNADLVTLSGCATALGRASGGEGFLGFSQALFVAGARSLVLSLWEVEDTPTMLLMKRFYENLLGRFNEPRQVSGQSYEAGSPLPKVDALREAKEWLRSLTWDEVGDLVAELGDGSRGPALEDVAVVAGDSDYPYEHPHYWAAFILMGSPD